VPWLPGYPIAPETSSCESAAYVHDCWGAIDLVRVVWSLSTLRPMYAVDAREGSQRENWPRPEHKQGVTQQAGQDRDGEQASSTGDGGYPDLGHGGIGCAGIKRTCQAASIRHIHRCQPPASASR
jgi:hypothetical protein